MGKKRVLTVYLQQLQLNKQTLEDAMAEVMSMLDLYDKEHPIIECPKAIEEDANSNSLYEVMLTSRMESSLMVMSKIKPSLTVEIKKTRKQIMSGLSWLVHVVCAEHKVRLFIFHTFHLSFAYFLYRLILPRISFNAE
jgi:hypothetical protein